MENEFKLTARKISENFLEDLDYENYLKYKDTWIDELENDIENYKDQELQKEKIKAQIEVLDKIIEWSFKNNQDNPTNYCAAMEQNNLKQQLKDLENA